MRNCVALIAGIYTSSHKMDQETANQIGRVESLIAAAGDGKRPFTEADAAEFIEYCRENLATKHPDAYDKAKTTPGLSELFQ